MRATSSTTRRSLGVLVGAAAASAGLAVGLAPAANADVAPGRDIPMAYPLGGEHTMRFGGMTICHWPDGKGHSPLHQTLSANARDIDVDIRNPWDPLPHLFPFNSATVEWTNHDTGASGSETVWTTGPEVGVRDVDTGIGDLKVSVTVTRSAFPTFAPGSVAPIASDTHTEVFELAAIDVEQCEGPIGG